MCPTPLPIDDAVPELRAALSASDSAVLTAPPGAGKTTRVPLVLLGEPWLEGRRVLMLEPRRLAARAAATRMAQTCGDAVGATVGYRIRHETRVGPRTRVEVVTEGVLTRLLQQDPSLSDYGCVIFDEFHERSLHADLGLALTLDARRVLRPGLRVLVMSATLDAAPIARLLGDAPVVRSEGRSYPVEIRYVDRAVDRGAGAFAARALERQVVEAIRRAMQQDSGSLLVFVPGMAEIRRVERECETLNLGPTVTVAPLHGELPQAAQDEALAPAPAGRRKIVLATSVAETSVTIEGIRVVIDAGLQRVARFDPRSGLSRLETLRVTRDAADQRCGRAGRTEPGVCYRLWSEVDQQSLLARQTPEILDADLTPLVLELAQWGTTDVGQLAWLDAPPSAAVAQARQLLRQLGALTDEGRITEHGREMVEWPVHPRLAHMMVAAERFGAAAAARACDVAALLNERDPLRGGQPSARRTDLRLRLDLLHGDGAARGALEVDRGALARARQSVEQWRRRSERTGRAVPSSASRARSSETVLSIGALVALAYPDRIAQRLPHATADAARYRLANGRGACFTGPDALAADEYLVIVGLDGAGEWARIDLAAPVGRDELDLMCGDAQTTHDLLEWDDRTQAVLARRQVRLGALVLRDQGLSQPDPEAVRACLCQGIRRAGLSRLPWTQEVDQWRARVALLRRVGGMDSGWPDLSDEALLERLDDWLGPHLGGMTRLDHVARVDLGEALRATLDWKQQQQVERLAPTHLTVPTGSRIRLDYTPGAQPVLAVRLQELFGCAETPTVADGRVPVLLHLLSPAGRPLQVTQDLARFWATSYAEVRKEGRGRYPKHHWPENPLGAAPTRRAKRPGEREAT
ncbi:MAG: ATP-dependent helicase HrpB [Nitrospiraceae bacterium]